MFITAIHADAQKLSHMKNSMGAAVVHSKARHNIPSLYVQKYSQPSRQAERASHSVS
jgi:hypothetical protein